MALAKPYWFSEEKWRGIVSTASLLIGVAAANAGSGDVLVAGVAGLVAGAMSMAAGEYVSVSDHTDQKVRLDQRPKLIKSPQIMGLLIEFQEEKS